VADDSDALAELRKCARPGAAVVLLHYVYVASKKIGARVAREIRALGFTTEESPGVDGRTWLVLARHKVVPTEEVVAEPRRQLETIASAVGGEYDGWEADLEAT
jgi:hypothetical protein